MKKRITLLAAFALTVSVLTTACTADDAPTNNIKLNASEARKPLAQTELSQNGGRDVCLHWVNLAPVIEENIRYAKEFIPDSYLQEVRSSYELDEIPKSSGAYAILDSMVTAADEGQSVTDLEQLARSICKTFPDRAVDDARGAYEEYIR